MAENFKNPRTLYDKIWDDHVIDVSEDGTALNFMARITLWSSEATFIATSGPRPDRTVTLIITPLATATT